MITNMSPLSLIDAAATPVTHVYTPASRVSENTARWVDREHNAGVAIGFATVTMSVKEPATADGVTRIKFTLSVPKVDFSVATAPKLLGTSRFNGEFIFPGILNDQERKDHVGQVRSMLVNNFGNTIGDNIAAMSLPY